MSNTISRGFRGRRRAGTTDVRLPPGQYLIDDFPVLSAGPTPRISLEQWDFSIDTGDGIEKRWTWREFRALPSETITTDIHCVTRWSKLDTVWEGVSIDTLLDGIDFDAKYVTFWCEGGYTTNIPTQDVLGGKAWIAFDYAGAPLTAEHGAPARLLIPHLYFWKSAKWVRGMRLLDEDVPGFWESLGYHNYGDPWRELRHWGD
jgi:DMSO/TMAO reductase YedYZ molybdopterin-dependent catalytic subunit